MLLVSDISPTSPRQLARSLMTATRGAALGALVLTAGTGCNRDELPLALERPPIATQAQQFPCEAEFTMEKYEEDEYLQSRGIPVVVDTIAVCQTWTGTDYNLQTVRVGSSDVAFTGISEVATGGVHYLGVYTPINVDGTALSAGDNVGPLLEYLMIDSTTAAAIEDDPYSEIRSIDRCELDPSSCNVIT